MSNGAADCGGAAACHNLFWGTTALGCCILTSCILSRFPWLIHKPKKPRLLGSVPVNIAHRGGQAERPENTLLAFKYAVEECGSDMIELDVQMTGDGKLVVFHDDDLGRVCGKPGILSQANYADLPLLLDSKALGLVEPEFYPEFTSFPEEFGREKIPLLEEVFEAFPNVPINLDLKVADKDEAIAKTAEAIHRYGRQGRTILAGFNQRVLDKLGQLCPGCPMAIGPDRILTVLCLFYLGLLPFVPIREDIFEIPLCSMYVKQSVYVEYERKLGKHPIGRLLLRPAVSLMGWLKYHAVANPLFIAALRRRGIYVFGWVANTHDGFKQGLERLGCDGVMTDRPKAMQEYLQARKAAARAG